MICDRFGVNRERVATFRHGPNQRTFCDANELQERETRPVYFSFIGSVHPRKGIKFFLTAARTFNQLYGADKVQFLVAGAGDARPYEKLINDLPNLKVINRFIENEEVNDLLGNSYALVLPYVGGMLQSSFPAIAFGNRCPVIAARIGSLYEEVDEGVTGYVVEKESADQITEAMHKVLSEDRYRSLSINAMNAYVAKFRWERIGEQMFRDMETASARIRSHSHLTQKARDERG
jgi:glycosyltransferase involved in cell wall biosynthesis